MEIVTLGFPIYQILKHQRTTRETTRALAEFDRKRLTFCDDSITLGSLKTRSTTSKPGKMYSMESLDEILSTNNDGLQVYAACMELNGENIVFLRRVLLFNKACRQAFQESCNSSPDFRRARLAMFRRGLSIYVNLVHSGTAPYPINIESPIYNSLDAIFGPAAMIVATITPGRASSISTAASASITPWDDVNSGSDGEEMAASGDENSFPLQPVGSGYLSTHSSRNIKDNESTEYIVRVDTGDDEGKAKGDAAVDPLHGVNVPAEFDERVFETAFKSVKYMVWTGTWQRYQAWKKGPGSPGIEKAV